MDGQTYAVAEYENQQNHTKNLTKIKTYIRPIFEPKGGRPLRGRLPFGANLGLMYVFRLLVCLHDFFDFPILAQHMFGHPFCNLKGWLGIILRSYVCSLQPSHG